MNDIRLGDRVRDTISGWEGIATARYDYINGCVRWQVDGADKDGKPDGFVFDYQSLEIVEEAVKPSAPLARTGGPRDNRPVPR